MKKTLLTIFTTLWCGLALAGTTQISPVSNGNQTPVINDNFDTLQNGINSLSGLYSTYSSYFSNGVLIQTHGGTGATYITSDTLLPSQTGNGGKFLTTNGTHSGWTAINLYPTYNADGGTGASVFASAGTSRSALYASATKVKEITLYGSGTLTISFTLSITHVTPGTGFCYGQIYRNGSAVGTLQNVSQNLSGTSSSNFIETISGWSNGDKIQLYAYHFASDGSNSAASVSLFNISGTLSTIDTD